MSPGDFSGHPIRQLLLQISEQLVSPELADPDLRSQELYAAILDSTSAITALVRSLLDSTPPQLVSAYALSQLQTSLQQVFNEISAYRSNRNVGHLQNVRNQLDQNTLQFLWAFAPVHTSSDLQPLRDAVGAISKSAHESVIWLIHRKDEVSAKLLELEKRILHDADKIQDLEDRIATQKAEAAAAVAQIQRAHVEQDTIRLKAFETQSQELKAAFQAMQTESEIAQAARLASLQDSQDQAAKIVQIVGNIGVTGNFQKTAAIETERADIWRGFTIAFFCAGIAMAGLTFFKFLDATFNAETAWTVLVRLAYAIAITAPAYYTARESARHRTNADRARQTELELASLGPFIELMPPEKKIEIREALSKRYFGATVSDHVVQSPLDLKDLRDLVVEAIKAAKK